MTVVNIYNSEPQAYIDKGFLVNHGIPAEVHIPEAIANIFTGMGGAGSIELVVPDSMAEKARKLLNDRPQD